MIECFSSFLLMVRLSAGNLRIRSAKCLAETTISPGSLISASMVQEIAMFKSIACISSLLSAAITWIPEKIGVLGLEIIAL